MAQQFVTKSRPSIDWSAHQELPPPLERLMDISGLQKMNDTTGIWQPRRFVVTAEKIYFSDTNGESVITFCNLWEVTKVVLLREEDDSGGIKSMDTKTTDSCRQGDDLARLGHARFEIRTLDDGPSLGSRFKFRGDTEDQCNMIIAKMQKLVEAAMVIHERRTRYVRSKLKVRQIFDSMPFQIMTAGLITANFIFNIIEAQLLTGPEAEHEGTPMRKLFDNIDLAFTIIFTVELSINMYGNWARPFFTNSWSLFDLLVVSVSLLALFVSALPGFSVLRLLRVFRVLRLFGRLKSLKKIITAVARSIVPVLNSFIILLLVACIYALIGIQLFRETVPDLFGSFGQAIIVMFQFTASGEWIDDLPAYDENGTLDGTVVVFCASFIVVVNWTLLQVSVAVLLDNFVSATADSEAEEERQRLQEDPVRTAKHALDPLLHVLSDNFDTTDDLFLRIDQTWTLMGMRDVAALTRDGLLHGLRRMPVRPRIYILTEDLEQILHRAGILESMVTKEDFRAMIAQQVLEYVQRRATDCINLSPGNKDIEAQMATNKLLLSMMNSMERKMKTDMSGIESKVAGIEDKLSGISTVLNCIVGSMGIQVPTEEAAKHDLRPEPEKANGGAKKVDASDGGQPAREPGREQEGGGGNLSDGRSMRLKPIPAGGRRRSSARMDSQNSNTACEGAGASPLVQLPG